MSFLRMWSQVIVFGLMASLLVSAAAEDKTTELTPLETVEELPLKNSTGGNGTNEQIFLVSNLIFEVGVLQDDFDGKNGTKTNETLSEIFNKTTTLLKDDPV